tara:strand:- start:106 stop:1047 length:942 start_codon:yes stop_codon:yes gene_type:complete
MNTAKFLRVILITLLFLIYNFKNIQAIENKILFKIDNDIITTIDIYEEIKFLKAFNPQINNLSDKELFEISKKSILRDKIKEIEISKYVDEIKVADKFLLQLTKKKYSKIGIDSIDSFESYLKNYDLNIDLIKKKFAIELIWNDLILQKFNSKIIIDKEKIKKEILKNPKKIQKEILLSEIVFSISKKSEYKKKYEEILTDIKQTGFKNAALIHSISNTASAGGSIGWIKEDNLNKNLKEKILHLKKGQYSEPILTSSGFLIIKIEDERENKLEFNLNNKIDELTQFKRNEQLNQFSNIYFNKIKKDLIFDDL